MLCRVYERRIEGCAWTLERRTWGLGFSKAEIRKAIRSSSRENRVSRMWSESYLLWRQRRICQSMGSSPIGSHIPISSSRPINLWIKIRAC